jgi:cytochrome c peroxidase
MSCGTCHDPKLAFTDGKVKSVKDTENEQGRNAPTLINSIYTQAFFYDLRAPKLSQQFEHVVFNENEFNTSLIDIFSKIRSSSTYPDLFIASFPEHRKSPVNVYTFKTALSSYVASLSGFDTEWDRYMRKEDVMVSKDAVDGYNLFMGKASCGTCHFAPTFSGLVPPLYDDSETEVLGVPADSSYSELDLDLGRYSDKRPKEKVEFYKYSFKTTTARNTKYTAPYMHNGVFTTLDEVIDFYDRGGGAGRGLEVPHQTLSSDSLNLSDSEKNKIRAFLVSLN